MSPSQENLPVVAPVLEEGTRKTLIDVRWLLVAVVGVFVAGASGLAFAQDAGAKAARTETAGLSTEQAALKANVKDLREEVADVKAEVRELRKDLRLLFPKLPPTDAGR